MWLGSPNYEPELTLEERADIFLDIFIEIAKRLYPNNWGKVLFAIEIEKEIKLRGIFFGENKHEVMRNIQKLYSTKNNFDMRLNTIIWTMFTYEGEWYDYLFSE